MTREEAQSYKYNSNGNLLTAQTDARGNTTSYAYDYYISRATGQPSKVTDANGTAVSTGFIGTNGRISSVSASGVTVSYTYGARQLKKLTRTANGKEQTYELSYDAFGNRTKLQVAGRTLASYAYAGGNGTLSSVSYGNGASVSYGYDDLGRLTQATYKTGTVKYAYTGDGTLGRVTDGVGGHNYAYTYDSLGRLLSMTETSGSSMVQDYSATYDTANRLKKATYHISGSWNGTMGSALTYTYGYNSADGSLSTLAVPGGTMSYSYDALKRLSSRTVKTSSAEIYTRKYSYLAGSSGTTLLVSKLDYGSLGSYTYAYDKVGNISKVTGSSTGTYTYDGLGQLLTATQDGVSYSYTYDGAGNLLTKTAGTKKDTYTYGDSAWRDLLTAYNGNSITYDTIGNPTTWYDGKTFTWANGRSLASVKDVATYKYNVDGLRMSKTANGVEHKYIWQGTHLVADTYSGKTTQFFYDESGKPMSMLYNGSYYYYITNLQGDVMKLIDASGTVMASYTYDPWGKPLTATGTLASVNPLRYRGYYYDQETGFYYCQSRYYDPEIGRFINADDNVSTGQGVLGFNQFAYCGNNPVSRSDDGGEFWHLVVGGIVGGLISGITTAATGGSAGDIIIAAAAGAVGGVLTASGVGLIGQVVGNTVISAVSNIATQVKDIATGEQSGFDIGGFMLDTAVGAVCGLISGPGASSVASGAGGQKQMVQLGLNTVKRTWNELTHSGLQALPTVGKEVVSAAKYYLKSTVKNTKNLFSIRNGIAQGIGILNNMF